MSETEREPWTDADEEVQQRRERTARALLAGWLMTRWHRLACHARRVRGRLRLAVVAPSEGQRIEGAWIWDHWGHDGSDPELRPKLAWREQEHHPGAKPCTVIIHGAP